MEIEEIMMYTPWRFHQVTDPQDGQPLNVEITPGGELYGWPVRLPVVRPASERRPVAEADLARHQGIRVQIEQDPRSSAVAFEAAAKACATCGTRLVCGRCSVRHPRATETARA
jgi:hypothetical protein